MNIFSRIISRIKVKIINKLILIVGNIEWVWPKYRIPTLRDIDILNNYEYKNPFLKQGSSSSYELLEFYIYLIRRINQKEPFTIVRMGDSEMYFLQGKMVGNVVSRSFLNNEIEKYNLEYWRNKTLSNDIIMLFNNPSMLKLMPFHINRKEINYKFDLYLVYQLVATKLLFQALKGLKIGIIGAHEKIDLIKELMKYTSYQNYLGINEFTEYIGIPQKGASADYEKTTSLIEEQTQFKADVYLVGMSVAKLIILPELRDQYKKTFIDVGVGIDAIAGIIPNTKAYFGNWINYRLKNYDYSKVNFFSYQTGAKKQINNIKYLDI